MPTKAVVRRFVEDPSAEFDHYLAERLGRTVAEMRRTVSNAEYVGWRMYYARKAQRAELEQRKAEARGAG